MRQKQTFTEVATFTLGHEERSFLHGKAEEKNPGKFNSVNQTQR